MNIQEFATIKHNKIPLKIFVLNNNGYLLIRHTQKNFMEGRYVGESPDSGVWCPDTLNIANAYGIRGIRINTATEIDCKLKEVFEDDETVVCEVMTPVWQLLIPRIASDKAEDGSLVSHNYEDMFPYLTKEELNKNMKED